MIPTIAQILADLEADKISKGQAQAWIDQHLALASAAGSSTLRDKFAMVALPSILTQDGTYNFEHRAADAYQVADAMLKAREA